MIDLLCTDPDLDFDYLIDCAADVLDLDPDDLQADFEHGQWWITHIPSGAQWSANDADPGPFDFEQVSQGDEDLLYSDEDECDCRFCTGRDWIDDEDDFDDE